jgi:hypothetical protein
MPVVSACLAARIIILATYQNGGNEKDDVPASVQIPLTSAPEQLPIFSASERKLMPLCNDIYRVSFNILLMQEHGQYSWMTSSE